MSDLNKLVQRFNAAGRTTATSGVQSLSERFNRLDGRNIYPGVELNVYQHGKPISGPAFDELNKPKPPTRPYDPMNPFKGMTGEEMSQVYQAHQNALLGVPEGTPKPELPSFSEFFLDIGTKIDQAGADLLDLFYKKVEETGRKWGELTAPKPIKTDKPKYPSSTDSFTDPEFEPLRGLSKDDAPYAYAGMRSAVGILSGPFHLVGGVGTIAENTIHATKEEGVIAGAKAYYGSTAEAISGFVSVFNPLDPDIDGPERFHRSLNVLFLASGGLKGFKSLRERGAMKALVKEHGITKEDARYIVSNVQKGLKQIDAETGVRNSLQNAIDDLTQNRMREIAKTLDPERFIAEAVASEFVVPVAPTRDMNVSRGQRMTGEELEIPFQENRALMREEADMNPAAMKRRAEKIQQQADHAFIDFINSGDTARRDIAAALNGRAAFLREQALLREQAALRDRQAPSSNPQDRTVSPAIPGDGPGPGKHAPNAGDPTNSVNEPTDFPPPLGEPSQSGRITVSPLTEGEVVRDERIWRDFFNRIKSKKPRQSDEVSSGKFDKSQASIVVRSIRNASAIPHEAGHQFNQRFKIAEAVPESELEALVADLGVNKPDLADEAAAEFVRGMLINPDEAVRRAPTMAKNWADRVPEEVRTAVDEAGARIRRVLGQSPRGLTLSQVRLTKEPTKTALGDIVHDAINGLDSTKPYKTPLHQTLRAWIGNDDHAALESAFEYIKEVRQLTELMPEEDAFALAARLRYVHNIVSETVAGGIRDEFGQVMYYEEGLGLLQRIGERTVEVDGKTVNVPIVRQVERPYHIDPVAEKAAGLAPNDVPDAMLVYPDGTVMDLNGHVVDTLGNKAEPMTLKWVLQPLQTVDNGPTVRAAFEEFVAQGVSERAIEIWNRKRHESLPATLDALLDVDQKQTTKVLEDVVNGVNTAYEASDTLKAKHPGLDPLTTGDLMDFVYGTGKRTVLTEMGTLRLLRALDHGTWKGTEVKNTVRAFQQLTRRLTGTGRGLADDVDIAKKIADVAKDIDEMPEDFVAAQTALRRYRAYSNALLRYLVKTKAIDQAKYEGIVKGNRAYFDLGRVMDDLSDAADVPRHHRDDVKALFGKASGSMREIDSPVVNLMANTEQAIRLGERNRMLNTFVDPIRAATDPVQKNLLASVAERVEKPGQNVIKLFNNGELEHWRLEPGVYEVLNPTDILASVPEPIMKVLGFQRDLLMQGVTAMPNFMVRNAFRDYMDARIKGSGISLKEFTDALLASDTEAGYYDFFGGGIAIWDDVALEKGWLKLQDEVLRQIERDPKSNIVYVQPSSPRLKLNNSGMLKKYGVMRAKVERAARLAEYNKVLEKARVEIKAKRPDWSAERIEYNAHLKAGQASRDLIDFARGAKVWKALNRFVPFVNARIQGFTTTVASIRKNKGNPAAMKALGVRVLTTMATLTAAEYTYNSMAGTVDRWRDQPSYLKDFYWLFPTPNPNVWVRIPKPFEWGILASAFPRVVTSDWDGFFAEDGSVVHGSVVEMLSPVAYDDLMFGPAQTVVELATNYDNFRRGNIVPPHEQDLALELRKGADSASNLGKGASWVIGALPFGDRPDPRMVDHAIQGFTGNAGQTAMTLTGPYNVESPPRWGNALVGLTVTDGSSNSTEVRKAFKFAASVGITGLFADEFDTLSKARGGDIFRDGKKVWEAKQSIITKAKRMNALIEERTQGKPSKEQLEIVKAIVRDFR